MAREWPHRMAATEPPERPNTIVMDITRREQQRAEETSVGREQNSSRLFPPGEPGNVDRRLNGLFNPLRVNGGSLKQMHSDRLCTRGGDTKSTLSPCEGSRQKARDENKIGKVGMCLRQIPSAAAPLFSGFHASLWSSAGR